MFDNSDLVEKIMEPIYMMNWDNHIILMINKYN